MIFMAFRQIGPHGPLLPGQKGCYPWAISQIDRVANVRKTGHCPPPGRSFLRPRILLTVSFRRLFKGTLENFFCTDKEVSILVLNILVYVYTRTKSEIPP